MAKYMLAYHGGQAASDAAAMPEEEMNRIMAAWQAWMESVGAGLLDPGNPFGPVKTITPTGVEDGGGANPLTGYTMVSATDIDAAVALCKDHPHLEAGGTIEVAEAIDMGM